MLVLCMGRIVITISNDLEKRFRDVVYKRYGLRRGSLKKAIEEALELWISFNEGKS
jgi:hypothetical protein